jgi:hypothetical protein
MQPGREGAGLRSCLILGSGRSGTSMVAGSLHAAGYHMGDRLLPASPANPRGYFEDRAVNDLNEDLLLQAAPLRPSGWRRRIHPRRLPYGYRWLAVVDLNARLAASAASRLAMTELVRRRPFCFKDPRFCYTLDLWRAALDDAVFVCVFGEPARTATSMLAARRQERRYLADVHISRRRSLRIWTSMYEHVLRKHRHHGQWQFVHYDQFLDGSAIPRLEALLETRIDAGFADVTLRRSSAQTRVPRRTATVYQQLCVLAGFERPLRGRLKTDSDPHGGRVSSEVGVST